MNPVKGLVLALPVSLAGVLLPGAGAAELPAGQAAPIEYVRICDAYGAGFFSVPGTDTCLRAGGLALSERPGFDPSFSPLNPPAGTRAPGDTAIVSKAFIPFAGLTAGRAQSMVDFSAGAYNYHNLRGSGAAVSLLAYTATFGNGFFALSFEDQPDRGAATGSTIVGTPAAPIPLGGVSAASFEGQPAGSRVPEIVGNLRLGQPWGAVQLSAAAHQLRDSLFALAALTAPPTTLAFPALTSNSFGFAVQGVQLNADYLSPGDKLWLQAAYEKGAFGYIAGSNDAFSYGSVNQTRSGGTPLDYGGGWNPQINSDCVFTASGICEQQWGWDITGAYKHYWLPILSSAIYGSYLEVHYPADALAGSGGGAGVSNLKEARAGGNLVWPPLKGFDLGAESMYVHLNQPRPAGLASGKTFSANGLPAFQPSDNQPEGRLRIQRAF
jgi:Porin subfamily